MTPILVGLRRQAPSFRARALAGGQWPSRRAPGGAGGLWRRPFAISWLAWLAALGAAGCAPGAEVGVESDDAVSSAEALTEGAALSVHDASCLQLNDQNTWGSSATFMAGVGPAIGLPALLQDLNRAGPVLGSIDRPAATGYKGGFRWNDGDAGTDEWVPQALTAGVSGARNVAMVAWHYAPAGTDKGVRVSVADITDMAASAVNYRHILLVRPTGAGTFAAVPEHGGGLAWYGNYLYMADTADGVRVFDLTQIRQASTDAACETQIGRVGSLACAYGYKYVLPQASAYVMPASVTGACRAKFSFLGKDTRGTAPSLLSGEYCNNGSTPCSQGSAAAGLGGRLYRWPVDAATMRLVASAGGVVKPERAFVMNEPNVQGVAPVMTAGGTNAYWLSSTRYGGALFKVATNASRKAFLSGSAQWARMPEGMHATGSGSNLWTVTEGVAGVTSPALGGRAVFFVDQAAVD